MSDHHLYEYRVVSIDRVVDGDTIDATISLGFGMRAALRFRVAEIDAPEIFGRYAEPDGQKAQAFAEAWLHGAHSDGDLTVRTYKSSDATTGIGDGAFGRWLGSFYDGETTLADAMAAAGLLKET